jgi:hypothetical protein
VAAFVIVEGTVLTPEIGREGRDGRFIEIVPLRDLRTDTREKTIAVLAFCTNIIAGHM